MSGASIDDEWGELIGDELSGPRPIGPAAQPHEPDEASERVPVPKKKGAPGKAIVPPPPRLGPRSPERRTDSVLAVPREAASSSRSNMRHAAKSGVPTPSLRHATRRLVVPVPGKPQEPGLDSDELPITVEDGGVLPDVPSWGGQRESKPVTIPPTLVPAASEELAVPVSAPEDPSGALDLKSVSHLALEKGEALEEVLDEDSDVISVEPVPVSDSDVLEVSPAVPKAVTEAVPRLVSDLEALAEDAVPEEIDEPVSDGVPQFGALDDVVVEPSGRSATFEPELAMTGTGGWKPLMPWVLGSAALLLLGSFVWMAAGSGDTKEQTKVAASAVAKASESSKASPVEEKIEKKIEKKIDEKAEPEDAVPAAAADPVAPEDEPEEIVEEEPEDEDAVEADDEPASEISAVDPGASKRYADAAAQYESTNDQESLEMMATSACAMDDGVKARSAFRKLVGGDRRSRVMVDCRERGVDVSAKGDGPTPAEMLRQAERALAAGDADKAEELARDSNRLERTQEAILLTAVAACAGGRVDRAVSLRRHLSSANRKTLKARCPGLPDA